MKAYSGFVKTVTVGNHVQTNQTAVCKTQIGHCCVQAQIGLMLERLAFKADLQYMCRVHRGTPGTKNVCEQAMCLMSAAICLTTNNLKLQSLCQPLNHKYSSEP